MSKRRIRRKGLRWEARESNITDIPKTAGVYALYYYGKRRYVGESTNLQRRIRKHFNDLDMPFTEVTWYETTKGKRHSLERDLIDKEFDDLWNVLRGKRKRR